jgi:hypothetical protein
VAAAEVVVAEAAVGAAEVVAAEVVAEAAGVEAAGVDPEARHPGLQLARRRGRSRSCCSGSEAPAAEDRSCCWA